MDTAFAQTLPPPYYAVIFTSRRRDNDHEGYAQAALDMVELARQVPGYMGMETARDPDGFGITVSYWESERAIQAWKTQAEHAAIRERGRWHWYEHFEVRVARVERAYGRREPA